MRFLRVVSAVSFGVALFGLVLLFGVGSFIVFFDGITRLNLGEVTKEAVIAALSALLATQLALWIITDLLSPRTPEALRREADFLERIQAQERQSRLRQRPRVAL